jgi:hypothetical protein
MKKVICSYRKNIASLICSGLHTQKVFQVLYVIAHSATCRRSSLSAKALWRTFVATCAFATRTSSRRYREIRREERVRKVWCSNHQIGSSSEANPWNLACHTSTRLKRED